MTIAEQLMKKGADAATKATERRIALNLQAVGFPIPKIAQLLALSEDEVEDRLRTIAS